MDFLQNNMKRVSGLFSGPKASVQIISDLHLDHQSQYLTFHIPVAAPYLILGGNIGRLADYEDYRSFLVRRCNLHEKVYLVLGALEFHGITWLDGLKLAHKMEQEPATRGRLEVLYQTRSDIPDTNVTILGCTLWSRIPSQDTASVLKKIPEFDRQSGINDWDVRQHNSEHKRDRKWLLEELKKVQGSPNPAGAAASVGPRDVVVVTSVAPDLHEALEPWQVNAPWASAFGSDLLEKGNFRGVKMWISGTTGRTCEFEKGGVTVVSNQRGRKGEEVTGLLQDGMSDRQKVGLFDVMRVVRI